MARKNISSWNLKSGGDRYSLSIQVKASDAGYSEG
jgi:hypothetical protein